MLEKTRSGTNGNKTVSKGKITAINVIRSRPIRKILNISRLLWEASIKYQLAIDND